MSMRSILVLLCTIAYLNSIVSARPQQWNWDGPVNSNPFLPNRQDPTSTTTSAPPATATAVPSPQYLACLRSCPSTMEYNPVCGSDNQNYHNHARLDCATRCGQAVTFVRIGTCNPL